MVLLTGDTHGRFERIIDTARKLNLGADDCIVILGDAGFNFYGRHGDDQRKRRVNALNVPVFCIHGNHEMRPATIPSYSEAQWHGGTVWMEEEYPNLLFAKDSETYRLGDRSAFVIGGAYSVDKYYRIARNPIEPKWWADEQPSEAIRTQVESALQHKDWRVDVVLTHTCPGKFTPTEAFLPGIPQESVDHGTEDWLDTIESRLNYAEWYCGHWHINKNAGKMHFLYEDWVELT